ncbi:MAG: sigma-70 family RNA polymerase sigma factor [Gemmataceae bacterium]|nr:sigma-70 family RNA polymerase sigma factor [Gemmataceae bacterium]MCI0741029.1 sigma-70 family RNA polymerase sigma factor [Gemmataceae bacterium]
MTWDEIIPLIERARAGDRTAFGALAERFQPAVFAVALARLRDTHEANELAQDVFMHAMTKLPQLRDPKCFVGWLRQIAVRMAINRLTRKAPVHGAGTDLLQSAPADDAGPLEEMIRAENRADLWTGLEKLKPVDRATLVDFYIRGRSLKQMAREFETPIGTIKRRLHVARKRLRKHLERGGRRRTLAAV